MKGIIVNNNRALVLDVTEVKFDEENPNLVQIRSNGVTTFSGINNTVIVRGNDDIVSQCAQSLVGTDGEVTFYNSKDKTFRTTVVNKPIERNKKSKELVLKNKTN